VEKDDDVLRHSEEVIARWHDPQPFSMCQMHLAPCTPFNVTPHLLRETAVLARKIMYFAHPSCRRQRMRPRFVTQLRQTSAGFVEELGWMGDDVWFAHGVQFNEGRNLTCSRIRDAEWRIVRRQHAAGLGAARIPAMLKRGIPWGWR